MRFKTIGAEMHITPPDQGEGHSLLVSIMDDDGSATFILRPDEAMALGAFLTFWGKDRIRKEGL